MRRSVTCNGNVPTSKGITADLLGFEIEKKLLGIRFPHLKYLSLDTFGNARIIIQIFLLMTGREEYDEISE
jgi:hypothetical protein